MKKILQSLFVMLVFEKIRVSHFRASKGGSASRAQNFNIYGQTLFKLSLSGIV